MKTAIIGLTIAVMSLFPLASGWATDCAFQVKSGGDGHYMYSSVVVKKELGQITAVTIFQNYCGKGFVGEVMAVALDSAGGFLYATAPQSFRVGGTTAVGKVQKESFAWSGAIPRRYWNKVHKIAVIQVMDPVDRMWTWIYQHRQTVLDQAVAVTVGPVGAEVLAD